MPNHLNSAVGDSAVGFDIGGTSIRCLRVQGSEIFEPEVRPIPQDLDGPQNVVNLVESILEMLNSQLEHIETNAQVPVGVGCAGTVDRKGRILVSPNITYLNGVNLAEEITQKLQQEKSLANRISKLRIENDVLAATYAELKNGDLDSAMLEDFIFVAFGTGIGAGRVIDGKPYKGKNNFWGEVGHMQITEEDLGLCGCGRTGCWEQLASGTALGRLATEWAQLGKVPKISEAVSASQITSKDIGKLVSNTSLQTQDVEIQKECEQIFQEISEKIVIGLKNLLNICDPGCIVLGGGMLELGEHFFKAIHQEMEKQPGPISKLKVATQLNLGGAIGAAQLVFSD